MRNLFVMLACAAGFAAAENVARPAPAECLYCYSGTCYNSSICGRGCVCMKEGRAPSGTCVGFDAAPPDGYSVAP